jgi:hypothetical protein
LTSGKPLRSFLYAVSVTVYDNSSANRWSRPDMIAT